MPEQPDRRAPEITLYERITRERLRDVNALDNKIGKLFDRLLQQERDTTAIKLSFEKRLGVMWRWQTAAIVLGVLNLLLWWRR